MVKDEGTTALVYLYSRLFQTIIRPQAFFHRKQLIVSVSQGSVSDIDLIFPKEGVSILEGRLQPGIHKRRVRNADGTCEDHFYHFYIDPTATRLLGVNRVACGADF